jgi:hypothetical protein
MHAFPALIGRCGPRRDRSGRPLACATSPPGSSTLEPEALHGPMGIGLQVGELSPCHAGLAEPRCQRLLPFSAFSACSCSLALSGPGEPLTLGCPLHPTHLRWGCCMHYCGAPDAGGSRLQAVARHFLWSLKYSCYCRAICACPTPSPSSTWSSSMITVTLIRVPVKVNGAS